MEGQKEVGQAMISVIVPVYNVEKYLRKCLDSVINQTYRNLEILIIDDGSTDGSEKICDEYKRDGRVKVFHTANRGLSAARNLGLNEANGDWIGFVDSDDWIEPDMYEVLLRKAEETGADIVECGCLKEYRTETVKQLAVQRTISGTEVVEALIRGEIRTQVWNKLWKKYLFNEISFPDGRSFEDIATTHKLLNDTTITGVTGLYYHYIQRASSLSQSHDKQNLTDYWLAHKQRYEDLKESVSEDTRKYLLRYCAAAISRTWIWDWKSECSNELMKEMNSFARSQFPVFGYIDWSLNLNIIIFLARFNNKASFVIAYLLNQLNRIIKPRYYE